nr:PREDICTED: uncharacterized protein LOC109036626 isoform X1 [Bemisia tabaci]
MEDNQISAILLENFTLLFKFIKPSKELQTLMKVEMFDKPNKIAMLQALHYLLPIFKPAVFKSREIHWPLYNAKDEADFRSGAVKVLTQFNSGKQLFKIPKTINFILSSARGVKAVDFLLGLTTAALTLTLQKNSKSAAEMCNNSKTLDPVAQLKMQADFCQEQDSEDAKFEEFISQSKIHEEQTLKKIGELKDENRKLVEQLSQYVLQNECFPNSHKYYLMDPSNNECIEKFLKELGALENVNLIQFQKIQNFKQAMNKLSEALQSIDLSKKDSNVFDSPHVYPKELVDSINQMIYEEWLKNKWTPCENRQLNLFEYMKEVNTFFKELTSSIQLSFDGADGVSLKEKYEQSKEELEKLRSMATNLSNSEEMINEKTRTLSDKIKELEVELFDDSDEEADPIFKNLLNDSPQIRMPSLDKEVENIKYEFLIDSPAIKKFASKLLHQLKTQKTAGVATPCHNGPATTKKMFTPGNFPTTPVLKEASICSEEAAAGPSHSSALNSNPKPIFCEDSKSDDWSPRGVFRLNRSIAEDIDKEVKRLSEHYAPPTPVGRRQSFLTLIERYKRIKELNEPLNPPS